MPKLKIDPNLPAQNPHHFLDNLVDMMGLKNDAALARRLGVQPPVLSKIRHQVLPVTANVLLKAHDASGMSITDLRALLYAPVKHQPPQEKSK